MADAVLRAVVRDEAVVAVTPEARLLRAMSRFSVRARRRLARVQPPLGTADPGQHA
ncbi:hypothetical protein AB0A91_31155 [Streptomyces sp. NPDC042207]|uniref:hypothetical protein n=1 Tax=Streptomyces sp. NPDC042207 TaxID=3154331 RepID=UPI0033F63B80